MAASVPHAESSSRLECFESQLAELEAAEAVWAEALQLTRVEQENRALAAAVASGTSSSSSGIGGSSAEAAAVAAACSPCDVPELSGTVTLGRWGRLGLLQLQFQFPITYPTGAPLKFQVFSDAPRAEAEELQRAVGEVVEVNMGAPCLLLALDVLKEAADTAAAAAGGEASCSEQGCSGGAKAAGEGGDGGGQQQRQRPGSLSRKVIWFHHIKNLNKRKAIVEWAHELQLGGFSKPGFPGVVIVEGEAGAVGEYVQRLRGLRWQAMSVRGEEAEEAVDGSAGTSAAARHKFQGRFAEVPNEDMSALAALCREAGAEALFLAALKLA